MAETLAENSDSLPLLPTRLDVTKVFRQHVTIEGSLTLSALSRLRSYLTDEKGSVVVKLTFDRDDVGHQRIHGMVRAEVHVQCQRCLSPMTVKLEESVLLAVVTSDETAKHLPENMDPWLIEPDDDALMTADIVEDQLILAMPIVSLHTRCSADSVTAQKLDDLSDSPETSVERKQNPFAVLARLKSDPPLD